MLTRAHTQHSAPQKRTKETTRASEHMYAAAHTLPPKVSSQPDKRDRFNMRLFLQYPLPVYLLTNTTEKWTGITLNNIGFVVYECVGVTS